MHLNLGTILQSSAEERPDHVAVRLGERTLTYSELDRAARGVATSLRQRGIEPGDAVALMVPNLPEFTMAYFGVLYAGATVVPLNVLLSGPEVQYHLEDSEAKLLVAHPLFGDPAKAGAGAAGVPIVWAAGEDEDSVAAMAGRVTITDWPVVPGPVVFWLSVTTPLALLVTNVFWAIPAPLTASPT